MPRAKLSDDFVVKVVKSRVYDNYWNKIMEDWNAVPGNLAFRNLTKKLLQEVIAEIKIKYPHQNIEQTRVQAITEGQMTEAYSRTVFLLEYQKAEVRFQCELGLFAYRQLLKLLEQEKPVEYEVNFYIHAMLTHTANVSKLFFPDRQLPDRYQIRGKRLRHDVEVSDKSLIGDRSHRNKIEHFGEELDDWALKAKALVDREINPRSEYSTVRARDILRNFNRDTLTFYYHHKDYSLTEIATELTQIQHRANLIAPHERIN